jgi:GTP-binding protein
VRRARGRRQERAEGPAIVVAIAGRPNAGKSTLFNRLFGRRLAIVDDMPGVTRDANRATLAYDGRNWEFVDTGGIEEQALGQGLAERVQERSLATLKRADAILHLVDGQAGLSAADRAVSVRIRQLGVPTLLVVNKIDRVEQSQRTLDFVELGEGDAVALSSAHGLGVGELWEALEALLERNGRLPERLPEPEESDEDGTGEDLGRIDGPLEESGAAADDRATRPPRIALVGRPNVGKSSLLNRLAGFERSLVDSIPGTTRDPIDVEIVRGDRRYVVVDTAGLRRPSRIHETIEGYAASASVRAIERAEVAVLVLDATVGVTDQDLRVADLVWRRGRGFVVAVNKVDLAPALAAEQCHDTIAKRLPQWPPLPLARVSATEGTGLRTLFAAIDTVVAAYRRRFPTPRLNDLLQRAVEGHPPPLVSGRSAKLMYAVQVRTGPHAVALFASRPDGFTTDYLRYLLNRIREEFGLAGVPVKLDVRARSRSARDRGTSGEGAGSTEPAPDAAPRRRRPRKGTGRTLPRPVPRRTGASPTASSASTASGGPRTPRGRGTSKPVASAGAKVGGRNAPKPGAPKAGARGGAKVGGRNAPKPGAPKAGARGGPEAGGRSGRGTPKSGPPRGAKGKGRPRPGGGGRRSGVARRGGRR